MKMLTYSVSGVSFTMTLSKTRDYPGRRDTEFHCCLQQTNLRGSILENRPLLAALKCYLTVSLIIPPLTTNTYLHVPLVSRLSSYIVADPSIS